MANLEETLMLPLDDDSESGNGNESADDDYTHFTQSYRRELSELKLKICRIDSILDANFMGSSMKWALFVAAATSPQFNEKLRPYPERFANDETGYGYDALLSTLSDTPSLDVLHNDCKNKTHKHDSEVIEIIHWLLYYQNQISLTYVQDEGERVRIYRNIPQIKRAPKPDYVFEINVNHRYNAQRYSFQNYYKDKYALYSDDFDNFYALLMNGFYTSGDVANIRLTTDWRCCYNSNKFYPTWGASCFGTYLKCIAMCRYKVSRYAAHESQPTDSELSIDVPADRIQLVYLFFYRTNKIILTKSKDNEQSKQYKDYVRTPATEKRIKKKKHCKNKWMHRKEPLEKPINVQERKILIFFVCVLITLAFVVLTNDIRFIDCIADLIFYII